ncbi:MAG: InlB B-repeat-containing protein, partial [Lachnospiraceae bacterium]|nr:InlB B-repeat-containing protein [Lachnospiraceae bacterium]
QSRSPFSRRGNIHIYNNLFDMQTNVCQDARANGFNFSEYNLFYDSKNPYSTQSGAVIKSYHDSVSGRSQTRPIDELYIVSSRSEDVPNSCRYAQGNVDYSSFETDSALSYIPEKDYVIQEDLTELRKTLAAYCGAMKENPVQPGYVEEDSYSKILRTVGDNVNKITALPYTSAPGDLGGGVWAFEVEDDVNVTVSYGEDKGVLVNAAGENLLEGDGTAVDIPEGKYMIRPVQFSPRTYEDTDEGVFSYGNISVVSLNITSSQTNRRITFDYNYDGSPGPVSVRYIPGAVIPDLDSFIPAGFSRDGYDLKGLYTDRELTKAVSFPYTVETNTTLYSGWKKRFYLNFDTGGGSAVGRARLPVGGVYDIIQGSAREGYIFAGWFDSPTGGYPVRSINADDVGSDITVYARWITDTAERMVLDCAALDQEDITEDRTVNGYTIHASSGMLGDTQLYMTAQENMLYTNGVLLTDTSIPGNEDGLLKSIEFDAEDAGVLSVTFSLSGNPEEGKSYNLALAKKTDTGMSETEVRSITLGKTLVTETFEIAGAGTYYLYAKGDKGVRYSLISFGKKTCALCFATGGGTLPEGLSDRVVELGETVHLKSCEPPAGYVFTGWTIDGTAFLGEDYLVKAEDVVNGVVTIKAVFEEMLDDPYLPDLPAKEDLSVTMLPGEVRRLSISRIGQYFYGVGWEVTYPKGETSRNFITVKNGVVTAKKLKKGTEKATALVTASYRSFSCTFTVTVNGTAYVNKPVTSGKKKYGINAPKSVKLVLNDPKKGSKAVSVSIPSQLRKADAEVSYAILTPDGQDYSGLTSGFVCDCASAGYNVPDRTKASKALFNLKALDAGSALIRWSMKDQETVAYTAVFVSKPLESLTSSENSLNLSVGEGARLIVTGTAGNTDPKDISFSVKMTKGKGIKVSKSGFVTAVSPGAAGEITIKLGKVAIKTPVKVSVSDWPSGSPVSPLTVNKTSVSVKAPKPGKAAKTAVLKIATPKKAADRPKSVKWVLTDYPEDAKAKVTVSGGTITVPVGASPGCYTVILSAAGEDAEKGYNTAFCEVIVR